MAFIQDVGRPVGNLSGNLTLAIISALVLVVPIVLFNFLALLFLYRTVKRRREVWETAEVELGENYIAYRQVHTPEVRIERKEIDYIQESADNLCVVTENKYRSIAMPKSLVGYNEVKTTISDWATWRQPFPYERLMLLLLALSIIVILISSSLWIILGVSIGLIGFMGYNFLMLPRYKSVDPRIRREWLAAIAAVIFVDAIKLCFLSIGIR